MLDMPSLSSPILPGQVGAQSSMRGAQAAELLSNWRLTPATLRAKLDPSWIPAKWLQYLSFEIASAISRGNCGLLISAPPRHGKSQLSTVTTPLWTLENFPHKQVIVATYGEELSTDFTREIRDTIQQNQDLLTVRLRADAQRVTNILTTKGGGLKAVGLRGAITGRGADVLIVDDYIKEAKEAASPTYLEDLWTWYRTVARTRLEPGAVVIILATRWVKDDLHGRIMRRQLETGRHFFKEIRLPAIAEANDLIGRQPGEVLFPERYSLSTIQDIKLDVGTRWFNAMFQQRPDDEETAVIKLSWFQRRTRDVIENMIQQWRADGDTLLYGHGWDMASLKEAGDFTVGAYAVYNKTKDLFIHRGMLRGQWSPAEAEAQFVQSAIKGAKEYGPSYRVGMEQEPGSSGKYSIRHFQNLAREASRGASIASPKLQDFPATKAKQLRAATYLAALEAGKVFIEVDSEEDLVGTDPEDLTTTWVRDFFLEAQKFPEGEHDDQVDASVIAFQLLSGKKSLSASIGRRLGANTDQTASNTPHSGGSSFNSLNIPSVGTLVGGKPSRVTFGRTLTNAPAQFLR